MDPATICKAFFTLGTAVDIGGTLIPSFRKNIMNYGSRSLEPDTPSASETCKASTSSMLDYLMEAVASFQVPHSYFTHYYIVSFVSSLFWFHQIFTKGPALEFLVHLQGEGGMTANQVLLAWSMMAIQGGRRLYESLRVMRTGTTSMWIGLYLIGIAYYIFMGISIWIEGASVLGDTKSFVSLIEVSRPSSKTTIAIPLFLFATALQHDCHKYLARLKKYSLPGRGLFQLIVCPHYTSECLIYVALAIVSAPPGQFLNKTILAGLGFVVSNLGVTADSTKKWYIEKFGAENVKSRWRMIPFLY